MEGAWLIVLALGLAIIAGASAASLNDLSSSGAPPGTNVTGNTSATPASLPEQQTPAAQTASDAANGAPSLLLAITLLLTGGLVGAAIGGTAVYEVTKRKQSPTPIIAPPKPVEHEMLPEPLTPFHVPESVMRAASEPIMQIMTQPAQANPTKNQARERVLLLRSQGHGDVEIRNAFYAAGYSMDVVEEITR